MNIRLGFGIALIGLCVGCASSQPTIRGQSPMEVQGPIIGSAPGYGELKNAGKKQDFKTFPQFHNNNFGYEGGYYSGPEGYSTDRGKLAYRYGGGAAGAGCPNCQYGQACPPSGCQSCGHNCPKHVTSYNYKWPQNAVYPPANQPPAMVQYPYYTFRGPTDFFMK